MNIQTLIQDNTIHFAQQPENNPGSIDFAKITATLVEHDYPAKTPVMWNAVYKEFNFNSTGNIMFVADTSNTAKILQSFRDDERYIGGGAGVGFKDEVIDFLDEIDDIAKEIGAVNFIVKTATDKLKGYNTDGAGYAMSLEALLKAKNKSLADATVLMLGAGGTGNAIAFALAERKAKLVILNRTVAKAQVLASKINKFFTTEQVTAGGEEKIVYYVKDVDVIINVSTKGAIGDFAEYSALAPAKLPANAENITENKRLAKIVLDSVPKTTIISDIILRNELTPLLRSAQDAGYKTLDGVPMVVNQGVEAVWLLHGKQLEQNEVTKEQVAEVMKKSAKL